jgi:hypothetical protein
VSPQSALALCGLTAVSLLLLSGCTGGGEVARDSTPTPELTVNGLPDGVSLTADLPTDVPNDAAARADVAIKACEAADDGWRATGTVVNPGRADATYALTVFFTTDAGTVIGFGSTEVDVPASGEREWNIDGEFVSPDPTLCVLRGVSRH